MLKPLKQIAANFVWKLQGEPIPQPHAVKAYFLKKVILKTGIRTLVETGTYKGDMIAAMKPYCSKISSIELNVPLFEKAVERFKGDKTITIHQGNSGEIMTDVIKDIDAPIIFWLDGHYSAGETSKGDLDTPIIKEIDHIAAHKNAREHVLLIDDARCFDGTNDYPTEKSLKDYLKDNGFEHFEKINDTYLASSKSILN
ncbi:MAG: hypothetical protein AB8B83_08430 [Bdellovibrionales bacterium]